MTRAIAGVIIVAAVAYVVTRLILLVAALVARARVAERERDQLRSERMPTVQDVRRREGRP